MVKCISMLGFQKKSTFWFERLIISVLKNQHVEEKLESKITRLKSTERTSPWSILHKNLDWGRWVSPLKPSTLPTWKEAQRSRQTFLCLPWLYKEPFWVLKAHSGASKTYLPLSCNSSGEESLVFLHFHIKFQGYEMRLWVPTVICKMYRSVR